jgi:hypothetical protein
MCFKRSKKIQLQFSGNLKYDWLGTISWEKQFYNVYGAEGTFNLHNGEKMPAIVFRLTSDNIKDRYTVIGRINPLSNYWSGLPYDILRIIENEFMPNYKKN